MLRATAHYRLEGEWMKIKQEEVDKGPGPRDSHSIVVIEQKMYLFGGGVDPLTPLDNNIYVIDLNTYKWSVAPAIGERPTPRLGAGMAAVGSTIYVFGGRDSNGNRNNDFYAFNTQTNTWKRICSGDSILEPRTYPSMTANNHDVYIFGGFGVKDQLKTLHGYNVKRNKWVQYPTPGNNLEIRGGAGLAVVNRKVWVLYGFNESELDDVHYFDLDEGKWYEVETIGKKPPARSMFATMVVGRYIYIYGGEIEPSTRFDKDVGALSLDIYALDTESQVWTKHENCPNTPRPTRRGWCSGAVVTKNGVTRLLVYGGNSRTNERLGDMYYFTLY